MWARPPREKWSLSQTDHWARSSYCDVAEDVAGPAETVSGSSPTQMTSGTQALRTLTRDLGELEAVPPGPDGGEPHSARKILCGIGRRTS